MARPTLLRCTALSLCASALLASSGCALFGGGGEPAPDRPELARRLRISDLRSLAADACKRLHEHPGLERHSTAQDAALLVIDCPDENRDDLNVLFDALRTGIEANGRLALLPQDEIAVSLHSTSAAEFEEHLYAHANIGRQLKVRYTLHGDLDLVETLIGETDAAHAYRLVLVVTDTRTGLVAARIVGSRPRRSPKATD